MADLRSRGANDRRIAKQRSATTKLNVTLHRNLKRSTTSTTGPVTGSHRDTDRPIVELTEAHNATMLCSRRPDARD